jgi:HD-GYP domain-containing protein (c-di-GMP phosphodiesterase class II)
VRPTTSHDGGSNHDGPLAEAVAVVRDAARHHLALELELVCMHEGAAATRSQSIVPLSDGRRLALLCWSKGTDLGERDLNWLRLVAQLITEEVERRRRDAQRWREAVHTTGLQAFLSALEARDGYTKEHSEAVVELAALTGRSLGLAEAQVDEIEQVALLHDLGKIAIPDPILTKAGELSADEWSRMQEHSAIGARIVASTEALAHLAPSIRATHERWDGRGYPDGLAGDAIPSPSRIVALCDAYDAMVSPRPYRAPLRPSIARDELARGAGSQFYAAGVEALLASR